MLPGRPLAPVLPPALVALTVAVYWPTLSNGFIWDDNYYVTNNRLVKSGGGLGPIWYQIGATPQYYPLVFTTFWAEYAAWNLNATGYHAVNMLLHATSAVLLWWLLTRLAVPGAWLAAAIFAVHPVHVESVAWITERKNVLSLVFALGSILAYLKFAPAEPTERSTGDRSGWYCLALGLFLAAQLSKTVTVSVPAVLLVIYWWKRGRLAVRDVGPLVPFFAAGIAFAMLTSWVETNIVGASGESWNLTPVERILVAGRAVWFYAGKLFWPDPLIFFYPRWIIDSRSWWQWVFPIAAVALLIAVWAARGRIGRGPCAAALIFGGVLVPALGFFNVYPFRYSYVADHFQYHASLGLIVLAAAAVAIALRRAPRWATPLVAVLIVVPLAAKARERMPVYRDLASLWTDTIAQNPESWAAHNNLGKILQTEERYDEAIEHYKQAIASNPKHVNAYTNWGVCLEKQGDIDGAIVKLREATAADPESSIALHELGMLLGRHRGPAAAIEPLRAAVKLRPDNATLRVGLASKLFENGETFEAWREAKKAVELNPGNPDAHNLFGVTKAKSGDYDGALEQFKLALQADPNRADVRRNAETTKAKMGEK